MNKRRSLWVGVVLVKIAIVTLTKHGTELGVELHDRLSGCGVGKDGQVHLYVPEKFFNLCLRSGEDDSGSRRVFRFSAPLREVAAALFPEYDGLIFIMAVGIVVRLIAPLLASKASDPAVVVMDEKGRFAVSLLSGHLGGANELAGEAAHAVGAQPVITTATDVHGLPAIDVLAKKMNMACDPLEGLRKVNAAMVNGEPVVIFSEVRLDGWEFPGNVRVFPAAFARRAPDAPFVMKTLLPDASGVGAAVLVTNKVVDTYPLGDVPVVFLRPMNLVAGVGCRKGIGAEDVVGAICFAAARAGVSVTSLRALASIDLKREEAGLLEAAGRLGVEVKFFSAGELAACGLEFRESVRVKNAVGVGGVCEPAAFLAAAKPARLILSKTVYRGVTVALAEENCR